MAAAMPAPSADAHRRCQPGSDRSRQPRPAPRAAQCRPPATDYGGGNGRSRALRRVIGDARVEPWVNHIEHEGSEAKSDNDGKNNTLDHKVIALADRLV